MKHVLTGLFLFLSVWSVSAQQNYFIFIQDAARRPFYVRMGEVSHSSSPTGHLLLSQLKDSVYQLFVGFPRQQYPEQLFTVAIARRDRGFELQQLGGEWRFFDLLSLQLIKPEGAGAGYLSSTRRSDAYAQLMAGVVNDSAVLYSTPAAAAAPAANSRPAASSGANAASNAAAVPPAGEAREAEGAVAASPVAVAQEPRPGAAADKQPQPVPSGRPAEAPNGAPSQAGTPTAPAVTPVQADPMAPLAATVSPQAGAVSATRVPAEAAASSAAKTAEAVPVPPPAAAPENAPQREMPAGSATPAAPYRDKRDIIRYGTENIREGKLFIYLDRSGPVTDTIRVIIPR